MSTAELTTPYTAETSWLTLDEWESFVANHPDSRPFHHRSWIELLIDQYGFRPRILAIKDAGEISAAVPFLETKRYAGAKKKLICLPFTDCLRVLAKDDESRSALAQTLCHERFENYKSVTIITDQPMSGAPGRCASVRHEIDLSVPLDELERKFPSTLQRNLRRVQKAKLRFESRTDEDAMEQFYRLHLRTRKKLGVPIQPKRFFRRLRESILARGLGFVGLVTKDERPIAAAVFLTFNRTIVYKYAASDLEALQYRPNECLVYSAIQWAAQREYVHFDFGISDINQEGLRRFKQKWGAVELQVYHDRIHGSDDRNVDQSRALKIASQVIRRSPEIVCRTLGEVFYRYRY